jgi:hypothetical protein
MANLGYPKINLFCFVKLTLSDSETFLRISLTIMGLFLKIFFGQGYFSIKPSSPQVDGTI